MKNKIQLTNAKDDATSREWLVNVYPMYLHDLSAYEAPETGAGYYQLNERGLWVPDYLPDWLRQDHAYPLIIHYLAKAVGFAFVGQTPFPFMSPDVDYRMSEFFVLRRYRREGIGTAAAKLIFDRYPGRWEVVELPGNNSAVLFWRSVISEYTDGNFTQTTLDGSTRQLFSTCKGEKQAV
jgi:predicted acetyltransferase